MTRRRRTRRSRIRSSGDDDTLLRNANPFVSLEGRTANIHEVQHVRELVEVSPPSSSKILTESFYCSSGIQLWVDLKIDSNSQIDLSPTDSDSARSNSASPQGSAPQVAFSDLGSQPPAGSENIQTNSDLLMPLSLGFEVDETKILELASQAMEELKQLAFSGGPLWKLDPERNIECINYSEYNRRFGDMNALRMEVEVGQSQSLPNPNPVSLEIESSRAIEYLKVRAVRILELLMDFRQWSETFSNLGSRATLVGVLASTGVERNYDGTLQVIKAEFHVPTLLFPSRESYIARYCKKLGNDLWGVVDVSLEKLLQIPSKDNFRRQPSGCVIQEMENGDSKVIWVEHEEVDNTMLPPFFQPLAWSSIAFGAKRWVNTLSKQIQWLATLRASRNPTDCGVIIPQPERGIVLKLMERIVRAFFMGISDRPENKWMPVPVEGAEEIKMAIKSSTDDPGNPPGTLVMFATSVYLLSPRKKVYSFLRDGRFRHKWDIHALNHVFEQRASISNGENPENGVSYWAAIPNIANRFFKPYLQESYTDSTGSYLVYSPIDWPDFRNFIFDENPDHVPILPSGFSVLPDGAMDDDESGGSFLTIAFHVVAEAPTDDCDRVPSDQQVLRICNMIAKTVALIKEEI